MRDNDQDNALEKIKWLKKKSTDLHKQIAREREDISLLGVSSKRYAEEFLDKSSEGLKDKARLEQISKELRE
jgi:hypothetical protein